MKDISVKIIVEEKIVIMEEKIRCDFVCLYPKGWKIENKVVVPSVIHYEESSIVDESRESLDKFSLFNTNFTKVYLLVGVKNNLFIHPNGKAKEILHPEDEVNGIHIMKKEDLQDYLKYKDNYFEKKIYMI